MSCGNEHCISCGSSEHFELTKKLDTKKIGDKTIFVYQNKCHKCGRIGEYATENADAIPAEVKIREEILTPSRPFNPSLAPEVDGPSADEIAAIEAGK